MKSLISELYTVLRYLKVNSKLFLLILIISTCAHQNSFSQSQETHILQFSQIPDRWDRGIPLGNGMIGVLVWQHGSFLRLSIDRADLWDLRPTAEIEKYSYQWAYQHKISGDWDTVWKVADEPYDRDPGPTKLPGAAVEFDIQKLGKVASIELNIKTAICKIQWENGTVFRIFVDALQPFARYEWQGNSINPILQAPLYSSPGADYSQNQVVGGSDLSRLGYKQGIVKQGKRMQVYLQKAWGSLTYQSAVSYRDAQGIISITAHYSDKPKAKTASKIAQKAIATNFDAGAAAHKQWWLHFWEQSSIKIPDKRLEKQWYMEMYKFGAASRIGSPPISLQAVWTADNGKLPPWKGDFHNDLNTQLSYWPAYTSNHLLEASVFTDWLWENKPTFEAYAKHYFGSTGLNVPGVATLHGKPMGGWHMYALSPTVGAWLSQHFYLQWKYSMDSVFLVERAYPWIEEAAVFIENITTIKDGIRKLPMGSSPEFNDGGINAWFLEPTNYDLALCKSLFRFASEMARVQGMHNEANHWELIGSQFPDYDVDAETGLSIAPGSIYNDSHRHFSHLMAFHPMASLSYDNEIEKQIIDKSIANLEKYGGKWWTGYSYAWLANIYARMHKGEKAAASLNIFATCFCSPNTFHLNGDQCKNGYSEMTYDPFTLEGNFAFASGLQEMLLQSHEDYIDIFPAIPEDWKDVSFTNFRAQGAFLVSAIKENGVVVRFRIEAPEGGSTNVKLPFYTHVVKHTKGVKVEFKEPKKLFLQFEKQGFIEIENGYE